jgi:hypothetical protein
MVFYQVLGMEKKSSRVEDRLDGVSNFLSWKVRVTLALKEYDFWIGVFDNFWDLR